MNINISETLLRQRWLVAALIGLTIVAVEIAEHHANKLSNLSPSAMADILVSGVAFPLMIGAALGVLADSRSKLNHPNVDLAINRANGSSRDNVEQRVLVVENEPLLGAGIESLLAGRGNVKLSGVVPATEAELIKEIKRFQPEIVILDRTTRLTTPTKLLNLLNNYPKLRVVAVSADDDLIHIYEKQQFLITQVTDLINVVHQDCTPQLNRNSLQRELTNYPTILPKNGEEGLSIYTSNKIL